MCSASTHHQKNNFKFYKLSFHNYVPYNSGSNRLLTESRSQDKKNKRYNVLSSDSNSNILLKSSNELFPNLHSGHSSKKKSFISKTRNNSTSQSMFKLTRHPSKHIMISNIQKKPYEKSFSQYETPKDLSSSQSVKSSLINVKLIKQDKKESIEDRKTTELLSSAVKNKSSATSSMIKTFSPKHFSTGASTTKESISLQSNNNIEGIDTPEELHFYFIKVIQGGKAIEQQLNKGNW